MNAENLARELLGSVVEAGTRALHKGDLLSTAGDSEHKLRQRGICVQHGDMQHPHQLTPWKLVLFQMILAPVFCCVSWNDLT